MADSAFARFGSLSGDIRICTAAMVNVSGMRTPLRFAGRWPNLYRTRQARCRAGCAGRSEARPAQPALQETAMSSPEKNITSVLKETRVFPPPAEFAAKAIVSAAERDRLADWAKKDPDGFWAEQAKSLHWFKPWAKVL